MLNGHGIHEIWALSGISIAVICAAVLVRYGNSLSSTYGGSAGLVVGHDIAPSRLLQGLAPHHAMPYNAIPYHITPYHIVILFAACFTLTVSSVFHITLLHWKNVLTHLWMKMMSLLCLSLHTRIWYFAHQHLLCVHWCPVCGISAAPQAWTAPSRRTIKARPGKVTRGITANGRSFLL